MGDYFHAFTGGLEAGGTKADEDFYVRVELGLGLQG